MTKEALTLALEALEQLKGELYEEVYVNGLTGVLDKPIAAIKEALAQPEQKRPQNCGTGYCSCIECVMEPEPVATVAEIHMSRYTIEWTNGPLPEGTKLYTTPPQRTWVGLTDEEFQYCVELKNFEVIAEEVEAKLKEKNT